MATVLTVPDCFCGGTAYETVFVYDAPPAGETRFDLGSRPYRREIVKCERCGHYRSLSQMDLAALYEHDYVASTYGDTDGVRRAFERINGLPAERSDNIGRVRRVTEYAAEYLQAPGREQRAVRLLDIGSGLGVFPYRMREAGWQVTAVEPDARLVEHTRAVVGVEAICGAFGQAVVHGEYDVVTFNKILEHVNDPVALLREAGSYLHADGFVYVEVPDGEMAEHEGPGREEFFVEHIHVFSAASAALLVFQAGFELLALERLREPSTKFTLRAFARTRRR